MKIAVCVKQVPDATVSKKIDPGTKRLDRSGEAALNPTDLNAVEEALRIKESQGGEVVLVSLGPGEGHRVAAQGARDGRGPRRARLRRGRRGLRPPGHELRAREGARARAGRPRPLRPGLERRRRRRPLGRSRRASPASGRVAGRSVDRRGGQRLRQAPDGARLRPDPRAAPGRRRGLRRDQRAALPVAQGDHGREDEAAGDARVSPISASRRIAPARRGRRRRSSSSLRRRRAATR